MDIPLFPLDGLLGNSPKIIYLKNHGLMHARGFGLFKPVFQWKERGIKG
jgi:hypothetical protein